MRTGWFRIPHATQLLAAILVVAMSFVAPGIPVHGQGTFLFQGPAPDQVLPPATIDALDPHEWSESELRVAPGQVIQITNRGVASHTFTVLEWGIEVDLPTLETVEIVIPKDVAPGEQYTFLCSEPGHQSLGQEGIVTIVTPEEVLANLDSIKTGQDAERVILETGDDFSWSLPAFDVTAGQFIEIRNSGVLEHHFVVDEWGINETVSAGEVKLVQVPDSVEPGQTFTFYCSVPGHRSGGMEGVITVIESATPDDGNAPHDSTRRNEPNLSRFLPNAESLGTGWSLVRSGTARAVVPDYANTSVRIFPGEGRGATFVGPAGSRATILVLPFSPTDVPTNQVEDAITSLQLQMMADWETDLRDSTTFDQIAPPPGCDVASRAAGVTRVYTLPAGSTVCQLRSAGIAIFVAVEGKYSDWSGVEAADQVVARLLQGA